MKEWKVIFSTTNEKRKYRARPLTSLEDYFDNIVYWYSKRNLRIYTVVISLNTTCIHL